MSKKKLYELITAYNMSDCRLYLENEITPVQMFYSEVEHFLEKSVSEGYYIYAIYGLPKHEVKLSKEDIDYITGKYEKPKDGIFYKFSKNLSYIKENQYLDFK
jgi:hypothetical protein